VSGFDPTYNYGMVKRIFSGWAIPGWVPIVGAVLTWGSTVQYAATVFKAAIAFLNSKPGVAIFLGFAWLTLVGTWPKWRPSWLRIPDSPRQRLNAIESRDLPALRENIKGLDGTVAHAHSRLKEQRIWISDIETSLKATIPETPKLSLFMTEIGILISQADAALDLIWHIKEYLPESDTAKAPFSKRWYGADASHPVVMQWTLLVERHITACSGFAATFHIGRSEVLSQALYLLGSTWDQPNPMRDCENILQDQRAKLISIRDGYASKFVEHVSPKVTVS
jgi:hypothetical protein